MRNEVSEAYRMTREFGFEDCLGEIHISVLLSDGSYLITPSAGDGISLIDAKDIAPQDMIKVNSSPINVNITKYMIHDVVYKVRNDIKAIVHRHTPAVVAISCLETHKIGLADKKATGPARICYTMLP
jgi:ribulose-5-phosphate 4-epimerase/fuculose-1-phosphate aldolase